MEISAWDLNILDQIFNVYILTAPNIYRSYSIPHETSYAGSLFARMIPSSWSPTELSLPFGSLPQNRSNMTLGKQTDKANNLVICVS